MADDDAVLRRRCSRSTSDMGVELRKVVRVLTVVIGLCSLVSSAALIFITSYLNELASQIDTNLQSVRAGEEIELQLLLHARSVNQAGLLSAPQMEANAALAEANVRRWLDTARQHIGSDEERTILATLESEVRLYFAKQAELSERVSTPLERYAQAAMFDNVYAHAERLLRVNVEQAAMAVERSATWDRIATTIGVSVVIALLVATVSLIIGAHHTIFGPLLRLGEAIRHYSAPNYTARAEEHGPKEVRAIARAFNEMAEKLERHRAQQLAFVASVAHDLRNPLAAMKAAVEASRSVNSAAQEMPPKLIALVSRQIEVLVRMVSELLDAAHIESGQFALKPTEHDACALVRDAIALFAEAAPLHQLVVSVPPAPLKLQCDSARMSQVVNNLLSNAIKYSPLGGRVDVRAAARGNGVVIEVTDGGIGIPEDEREAIFEPFRRGRAVNGTIGGVGIGLSVARRIVNAHGGTLTLHSAVGAGSTFTIWLPAVPPPGEHVDEVSRAQLLKAETALRAGARPGDGRASSRRLH